MAGTKLDQPAEGDGCINMNGPARRCCKSSGEQFGAPRSIKPAALVSARYDGDCSKRSAARRPMLPLRILLCLYALAALSPADSCRGGLGPAHLEASIEFAAFYAAQGNWAITAMRGLRSPFAKAVLVSMPSVRVVEGRADFGVGTSALVLERYQGKPVVALATLMQHSPIALLARRASNRSSVMTSQDSLSPSIRTAVMRSKPISRAGLKAEQIRFVDQSDWTLDTLDRGEIAAKVVYVSNEPFLIRDRQHDYLLLVPDRQESTYTATCCSSREEVIRASAHGRPGRKATLRARVCPRKSRRSWPI